MLKVRNVSKSKGRVMILKNVSFDLEDGETLGLFGPNGSGKSTLMKIIAGIETPSCGKVFLDDLDVTALPPEKMVKLGVVYAFQIPRNFRDMTVLENLAVVLMNYHSVDESFKLARKMLRDWDLDYIAERKVEFISHGESRLLEILKAYATNPRVLLLDEPFAGLDVENVFKVREKIERLREEGLTMIITSHRRRILSNLADRFLKMEGGKIVES